MKSPANNSNLSDEEEAKLIPTKRLLLNLVNFQMTPAKLSPTKTQKSSAKLNASLKSPPVDAMRDTKMSFNVQLARRCAAHLTSKSREVQSRINEKIKLIDSTTSINTKLNENPTLRVNSSTNNRSSQLKLSTTCSHHDNDHKLSKSASSSSSLAPQQPNQHKIPREHQIESSNQTTNTRISSPFTSVQSNQLSRKNQEFNYSGKNSNTIRASLLPGCYGHTPATYLPVGRKLGLVFLSLSVLLFASSLAVFAAPEAQAQGQQQQQQVQKQQLPAESRNDQAVDELKLKRDGELQDEEQQKKSIVASLSSAVASAAAAAAVAAAKSSLSGSDSRSVLNAAAHSAAASVVGGHQHVARSHVGSSALNTFVSKNADAGPEVPYSILHNMKKLDHAAPFYNVARKFDGGSAKESTSPTNFLISLLTGLGSASGNRRLSDAAEQLTAIVRSPVWKKLSDRYGGFTSEFRSLFGATKPTTMKGPTGSSAMAKVLRDFPIPLIAMLALGSLPGFRPVRTHRTQASPVNLLPSSAPLPLSDKSPSMMSQSSPDPLIMSDSGSDYSIQNNPINGQQQLINYLPQVGQVNLNSNQQQQQQGVPFNFESLMSSINGQQPRQQQNEQQQVASQVQYQFGGQQQPKVSQSVAPLPQHQQQQQSQIIHPKSQLETVATKRLGDNLATHQQVDIARKSQHSPLASSLTSVSMATGELLNKIMARSVNGMMVGGHHEENQQVAHATGSPSRSLVSLLASKFVSPVGSRSFSGSVVDRSDQQVLPLSDKHRYSLVGGDSPVDTHLVGGGGVGVATGSSSLSQAHLANGAPAKVHTKVLSAMTHAIGSLLSRGESKHQQESGYLLDHKSMTINQQDKLMRRQQQRQVSGNGMGMGMGIGNADNPEQRDLSQLVPASWKEVVKRTVNNVQQQANSQWKSIEGQLTNWVQDRLKSLPGAGSSASSASGSTSSSSTTGGQHAAAPVSNLIASVSSSALNLLGLGNKSSSGSSSQQTTSAGSSSNSNSSNKESTPSRSGQINSGSSSTSSTTTGSIQNAVVGGAKAALVGMADVIINTLTNRNTTQSNSTAEKSSASAEVAPSPNTNSPSNFPTQQSSSTETLKVGGQQQARA